MAKVPIYSGQHVEAAPTRINNLSSGVMTVQATPDAFADKGLAAVGKGAANFGNDLASIYQKEQDAFDEARAQEAYTKLMKANNDAVYGDAGVIRLQGAQAVGAAEKWAGDFDKASGELTRDLNPRQVEIYTKHAQGLKRGFYDNVLRHEAQQGVAYREDVYKSVLTGAMDVAGKTYRDPEVVGFQTDVALRALRQRPEYMGADAAVRGDMERGLLAAFNSQVIDAALNADDVAYANAYFKAVGKDMPLPVRTKIENRLKPATDFEAGRGLAMDVHSRITAGSMSIAEGEAWIASNAKTKDQMSVAQSIMREMQDAQRRQAAQVSGSFIEKFEQAPSRATMLKIQGDKAFQSMEPEARAHLVKYMRQEVEQADDRYRARRNEQYRSPETYAKFLDVLDSPDFAKKSRQEIYALRTELGPELTGKLLAEHKGMQTAQASAIDKTRRFKIDDALIREALPPKLQNARSDEERAQKAAFMGIVASELALWKADNPGKLPDLETQKAIARSANAEWISIGKVWNGTWFGGTQPRYMLDGRDPKAVPKEYLDVVEKGGGTESGAISTTKLQSAVARWRVANPGREPTLEDLKRFDAAGGDGGLADYWRFHNQIPQSFYDQSREWAAQRGLTLTEAEIEEMWNRTKERGR